MAGGGGYSIVVQQAVTDQRERLRFAAPLESFQIKEPQVPVGADEVSRVRVHVLRGECGYFRRAVTLIAEVPLGNRDFRGIDGLNAQFGKSALRSGERRSGEEAGKLRDHRRFGEVARPDAQIRSVGHFCLFNYTGTPKKRRIPRWFKLKAVQCGSGAAVPRLEAIWARRSRRESPISEKTLVQVSRSFSSAVAAMPETTSRDWWSSEATVASIH